VCISGKLRLINVCYFASLLFYILTILGFILEKEPHADRPYKAFGYPLFLLFIL
jgi:APA family basic amino acid/polyamine antiporter